MKKMIMHACLAVAASLGATTASAQLTTLKSFDIPEPTTWRPEGCRDVGATLDAQASQSTWRNLHSDQRSSDEVTRVLAPVFETDWTVETATYNATGPVFDSAGGAYFAPLASAEPVIMIALDPSDGSRRWAIPNTTGAVAGFHTPIVLKDPTDAAAEAIFLVLADRAVAVRPDGSIIWDVAVEFPTAAGVISIQYHGPTDSLIAVSTDGYLLGIDRMTGEQSIPTFELPGEATPLPTSTLPPAISVCLAQKLATLTDLPAYGLDAAQLINVLLGNNVEVANSFSIDTNTGRLWIAATAPDETDGTVDGVSEFGALYGIDIDSGNNANQVCRVDFSGGSAATPALKADGSKVYTADNDGLVLAYNTNDCSLAWSLDVGDQVFGSIGVASDNDELYASTRTAVRQIFDRGTHGELGWTSSSEVFDIPFLLRGVLQQFNSLLAGVSANGVGVQVGVGVVTPDRDLPLQLAVVVLDRETGQPKWASEGLDESVAVDSIGPDGSTYLGNSPIRRIITLCILELQATGAIPPVMPLPSSASFITPPQLIGGITKYAVQRADLLIRDAACAAEDRAKNAFENRRACPDSSIADITQIQDLIDQARSAAPKAIADGDLTARQWAKVDKKLTKAETKLNPEKLQHLNSASKALRKACRTAAR